MVTSPLDVDGTEIKHSQVKTFFAKSLICFFKCMQISIGFTRFTRYNSAISSIFFHVLFYLIFYSVQLLFVLRSPNFLRLCILSSSFWNNPLQKDRREHDLGSPGMNARTLCDRVGMRALLWTVRFRIERDDYFFLNNKLYM